MRRGGVSVCGRREGGGGGVSLSPLSVLAEQQQLLSEMLHMWM